jgi:RHS repeat-associated protein
VLTSSTTSATGKVTTQRRMSGYDKDGRPSTITDENGSVDSSTIFSYTAFDAVDDFTESDGQRQDSVFATDLQTGVNRAGTKTGTSSTFQLHEIRDYNRRGLLSGFRVPTGSVTSSYTRDGLDRVVAEAIPAAGVSRSWVYDDVNRVRFFRTRSTSDAASTIRRQERRLYDGLGRVLEVCDKTGDSTPDDACAASDIEMTYVYDTKGPFVSTTCGSGTFGTGITLSDRYMQGRLGYVTDKTGATAYEYDALGRVRAVARHDGPVASYSSANVSCVVYTYNAQGAVSSVKYPSSRVVVYGYGVDKARPSSVTMTISSVSPTTLISNIVYETDGSVKQFDWAGSSSNRRTVTRDQLLRPTAIVDQHGGVTKSSVSYTYDGDGDVLTETDSVAPTALATNTSLAPVARTYLQDGRRDIYGGESGGKTLTYDSEGRNVSFKVCDTCSAASIVYNSSFRQRRTSDSFFSYVHDSNGELYSAESLLDADTSIDSLFDHGLFGQVTSFSDTTGTWTYSYDSEMRRVQKTPPVVPTNYRWLFRYGLGREIMEDIVWSSATAFDRTEFVYLGGEAIAAVRSINNTSGTLYRIHTDWRSAQGKYDDRVYGARCSDVGRRGWRHRQHHRRPRMGRRYAGQYWDEESDVINNGYRSIYNGMYTSPDPLHMQTQGRYLGPAVYTYAANRPQVYQDPDGRLPPDSAMWDRLAETQLNEMKAALDVREFATRRGREAAAAVPGATGGFSPTGDKCSDENALRHCIGSCIFFSEGRFGSSATIPMFIHELGDWSEDSHHDRKNNLTGQRCAVAPKGGREDCVKKCVDEWKKGGLSKGVGGACTDSSPGQPDPYWPPH